MGGVFAGSVPIGKFIWGDPGHSRCINHIVLSFVQQKFIQEDLAKQHAARTDYTEQWSGNFAQILMDYDEEIGRLWFGLQKQPPLDYNKLKSLSP